jgi:acyl-CoA synthetase (AMP-forming)/AMP-acid ligase II
MLIEAPHFQADTLPNTRHHGAVVHETLVDLLRWRAERQPDQIAYTFLLDGETDEARISYQELDRRARAIGALLQDLNASGERALLLYPPGLDFIAAFFGCLYAGVIAVPAYPPTSARMDRMLPRRLRAIAEDAKPLVALTTTEIQPLGAALAAQDAVFGRFRWLATDTLADDRADGWQPPTISAATLAFLQYTSGSTSTPKGVMLSHGNLLANELMIQQGFGHTEAAPEKLTIVGWLPLYHDMGLIGNVLQPLYLGAHCVLMSPLLFLQRPLRWLQAISRYRAHTSGGPNFAYELCVQKIAPEKRAELDLSSWKVAFNGAEPVRASTIAAFSEAFAPYGFRREAFYPCYGLAEASLFVTGGLPSEPPVLYSVQAAALEQHRVIPAATDDPGSRVLVSSGRAWLDEQVAIVDPESCRRCAPDQVGEIWASGPHIAQGYLGRPAESSHTFQARIADTGEGPFLRTGDLGFLKDGELFVTGRIKDMIIIDGRNHYPQDIELTVEQAHPAIRSGCCAAFAIDVAGAERLVVVAEIDRHYKPARQASGEIAADPAALIQAEGEAIARTIRRAVAEQHDLNVHAVQLLKLGGVAKTSSGKIQRHACRAGFLEGTLDVWGATS